MSSFRLRHTANTPPKGFRWIDPITLMEVTAQNYANWTGQAADHRVANALPLAEPLEMEAQLCAGLSEKTRREWCMEYDESGAVVRLGVGGTLKSMFASFGISACFGCLNLAGRMDAWGPDGCEEHMEEIVGIIEENASQKNWARFIPFKAIGARAAVLLAIRKVRERS